MAVSAQGDPLWTAIAGALVIASVVLVAAGLTQFGSGLVRRATAGFSTSAGWTPVIATLGVIVAAFVVPNLMEMRWRGAAIAAGITCGFITWLVLAFVAALRGTPSQVNSRVFSDVTETYRGLRERLDGVSRTERESVGYTTAAAHLNWLRDCIGMGCDDKRPADRHWTSGYRYIDLWSALHRADEALLSTMSTSDVDTEIERDHYRLAGSRLTGLKEQLDKLRDPTAAQGANGANANRRRGEIVALREALNQYRLARMDGLVRARNRLARTTMSTAWVVFLLVAAAIALNATPSNLAAGSVFFFVGALIGLFAQLRSDAEKDEAVEDYGLAAVRLRQTALASGIAGVAGVILTAVAISTTATDSTNAVGLAKIFHIGDSPGQLLIAAVFGLSPHLLIERLTARADEYRKELGETAGGEGSSE